MGNYEGHRNLLDIIVFAIAKSFYIAIFNISVLSKHKTYLYCGVSANQITVEVYDYVVIYAKDLNLGRGRQLNSADIKVGADSNRASVSKSASNKKDRLSSTKPNR